MSLGAFQAALGRLVSEPAFRERIRSEGSAALDPGLSEREHARIMALASDPGIRVTARLIASFRLAKLLALLPLTRALLGPRRLAREAEKFWERQPPTSFYLVEEALAFCDHLLDRARSGRHVPYLREVTAYERAMLELRRVRPRDTAPPPQRIEFCHDPARLLPLLAAGKRPRGVRRLRCTAVGRSIDGVPAWSVEGGPARRGRRPGQ